MLGWFCFAGLVWLIFGFLVGSNFMVAGGIGVLVICSLFIFVGATRAEAAEVNRSLMGSPSPQLFSDQNKTTRRI